MTWAYAKKDLFYGYKDSEGYRHDVDITETDESGRYTFTMPAADVTVYVTFGPTCKVTAYSDDVPKTAGEYTVRATIAEADPSFTGTATANFTINKKPLTVTANTVSKTYGDNDPELTYEAEGLVGSDQLTGALDRAEGENVGSYAITQGTLAAGGNYDMTFTGAKLTINKKALTVTADAKSKTYGDNGPELTYKAEDLVGSDKLTGALDRAKGENVGSYAITQGTLSAGDNYDMTFTGAKLTISAKPGDAAKPEPAKPANPDYTLLAEFKTSGNKALTISWTKVSDAQGYDVFFRNCDGKGNYPLRQSVGGAITSYTIEGLKKGKCYKGYVMAWKMVNGAKVYIGKASPTVHAIAGGYTKKFSNAKKVTVKAPSVALMIGKTSTIKASLKLVKSGRKLLNHTKKLRYFSSDRNVATVSSAGKIKAVGTGSCTIYAMAINGVVAKVEVTVVDGPMTVSFKKASYSVKKGTVTITVTTANGKQASTTVKVK